jgi:uncharacterized protein (UPF0218 family)
MNIGDLVEDTQSENNLGIIVEILDNKLKSGNVYKSYMIHWLKTGFKSTHGIAQLVLLNKHFPS